MIYYFSKNTLLSIFMFSYFVNSFAMIPIKPAENARGHEVFLRNIENKTKDIIAASISYYEAGDNKANPPKEKFSKKVLPGTKENILYPLYIAALRSGGTATVKISYESKQFPELQFLITDDMYNFTRKLQVKTSESTTKVITNETGAHSKVLHDFIDITVAGDDFSDSRFVLKSAASREEEIILKQG